MPETKLAILTPQSRVMVWAMTGGGIPRGLAVTLIPMERGQSGPQPDTWEQYTVTHRKSGKRIGPGFEELRDARHVAEALGSLADWSLPEFALRALPEIEDRVRETLDRALTELDEGGL